MTGQLMTSPDKVNWQTLVTMGLRDFDVGPTDPRKGATWSAVDMNP